MAYYNGNQLGGLRANMTVVDEAKLKELSLSNEPYNNKKVNDVNNIVGYKGYKMIGYKLSSDGKSVEIELRDAELDEKAIDNYGVYYPVNIEANTHSYQKEQITNITTNDKGNTVVTLREISGGAISFKLEDEDGTDLENWLYISDEYVGEDIPQFSHAVTSGVNNVVAGYAAFAGGRDNKVFGNYGAAFGRGNIATYLGFATGRTTKALGHRSVTHGNWTEALGDDSIALGDYTKALGKYSIAMGCMYNGSIRTMAQADNSIALGQGVIAGSSEELGKNAIATGCNTRAYGASSLTLGTGTRTGLQGQGGDLGLNALAGGQDSVATGRNSLSFGEDTNTTCPGGLAIGGKTKSDNSYAIALCYESNANAYASLAAGMGVKTNRNAPQGQAALGKYNVGKSSTVLEVGNGTVTEPANAFEVNLDGTATVQSDPKNAMDVATKQYVDRLEKEIEILKQAIINLGGTINV